jgi:hypothetical protein
MEEPKDLLKDIEILRETLIKLIQENNSNLQSPDVIAASQILNAAIAKYNEFIKNKL